MAEEFNEEEKEKKIEKDVDRIDKDLLQKAKNSRDLIDKKLRTFENSIDIVSNARKTDVESEKVEGNKITFEKSEEIKELEKRFEVVTKKINDKEEYLIALEEKISGLEEIYNRKIESSNTLNEELAIVIGNKEKLETEYNDLQNRIIDLNNAYEARKIDLTVLQDKVKEKLANQDELRNQIAKFNQVIQENEENFLQLKEESKTLDNRLISLRTENEGLRATIDKNKEEISNVNNLIEAKENEIKLLNGQIEKKEERLSSIELKFQEYNEQLPEIERRKDVYDQIIRNYVIQVEERQQKILTLETKIIELNESIDTIKEQILGKENLISLNEKRLNELKVEIEIAIAEHNERENLLKSITEKLEYTEKEHEKLTKAKDTIDKSISESKEIFQQLKKQLDGQEEEIRDKESRINRLEILSLIYRASKFFGGILIGIGIFFLIIGFGYLLNIFDFGEANPILIILLSLVGAGLIIVSGIFHLEKS